MLLKGCFLVTSMIDFIRDDERKKTSCIAFKSVFTKDLEESGLKLIFLKRNQDR